MISSSDGYRVFGLKGVMTEQSNKASLEDIEKAVDGTPSAKPIAETAPIAPAAPSGPSADLQYRLSQCQQKSEAVAESCDENASTLNKIRNELNRASSQVAGWAQQSPQACNQMVTGASGAFSSGMGLWNNTCGSALSDCINACDPVRKDLRSGGFADLARAADTAKAQCTRLGAKKSQVNQNMEDAKNTALAGVRCQQDALAQQQALNQPGLMSNPGFGSVPPGGGTDRMGSGFSNGGPATLGGSGRGYDPDERATGAGGTPTSLGDGASSEDLAGGKPYEKSQIGQLSLGGAGGGVSGKVTYSDSSMPKSNQRNNQGGGGSTRESTVNSGFYGGGGAIGGGAFKQAAIAPVGGYRANGSAYNPNLQANGKPDLRRFMPPGGPKRVAASPSGYVRQDSKTGKDGVTGPRTNNFHKVSNRYNSYRATLVP